MTLTTRRAILFLVSLISTFMVLRISLYLSPNSNFDIGPYNIHHLFTGVVVMTFAVIPLLLHHSHHRIDDLLVITFGIGLSMVLDEWVYLIATDGSDASYLLPVSLWGGIIVIGIACIYTLMIWLYLHRCKIKED